MSGFLPRSSIIVFVSAPDETAAALPPRLFVPGLGAPAGLYRRGLPAGWDAVELPSFRATRGDLDAYAARLRDEIARRGGQVTLAGHSMGAALAVLAAADAPETVERLLLLAPSGLPHTRPLSAAALAFVRQVARRRYPLRDLGHAVARGAAAPRAAFRLARDVHELDLSAEAGRVRTAGIRSTVVGCTRDRLATPEHCRRLADLLAAEYRELDACDGHIWPITEPELLRVELRR
jgi:pimeloyl-ACP methyl ester carboxylesterase